jgi:hypothetical protein
VIVPIYKCVECGARVDGMLECERCGSTDYEQSIECEGCAALSKEVERLTRAIKHIAAGNISPSIGFAKRILEGMTVKEAHEGTRREMDKCPDPGCTGSAAKCAACTRRGA